MQAQEAREIKKKDAQGVVGNHRPVRSMQACSITILTPSSTTIRKDAAGPGAMPGELFGDAPCNNHRQRSLPTE